MEYRRFGTDYVVRIDRGEEVMEQLTAFCRAEGVKLASVTGIGATDQVVVGLYDVEKQMYHKEEQTGPMEITTLVGRITTAGEEPYLHLHINVCGHDLAVKGGHLNACRISATCELTIHCIDGRVGRKHDEETGLNLFQFEA